MHDSLPSPQQSNVLRPRVQLLYGSISPHIQQLYTGLLMLHRRRVLTLTQRPRTTAISYHSDAPHLRDAGHAHADVVVNSQTRIHFDTHDSPDVAIGELDATDFYFKRSYSPTSITSLPASQREKILPLGLNYNVLPDGFDIYALKRRLRLARSLRQRMAAFKFALDVNNVFGFQPRMRVMQSRPVPGTQPRVLFLVAAYDPYDGSARSAQNREETVLRNETRARCIALLRKELGSRFMGGFTPSRFALERYGKLVVTQVSTTQEGYLRALRDYPICVATTGLHGSSGWKLAEYVAFSKAIVSETLQYAVPGEFEPNRNFLEFTSAEQCVQASVRLIEDADLRRALMHNNERYYHACVRPDSLVLNALRTAMTRLGPQVSTPDHFGE